MSEKILADKFLKIVNFYNSKVAANRVNYHDKVGLIKAMSYFWYCYCKARPNVYSKQTLDGYKNEYLFPNNAISYQNQTTCVLTEDSLTDLNSAVETATKLLTKNDVFTEML